jgi:rubrerythrin
MPVDPCGCWKTPEALDRALIADSMLEENGAIANYRQYAAATTNPLVRDLFLHIVKEEEQHWIELRAMLERLQ